MPVPTRYYTNKFNRGEIDDLALARDDVVKVNNSGSLMSNFMPIRLGAMQYRPGTKYLGAVAGESYCIPFVAATDDTAILEFSNNLMRVWVSDSLVARTSVTTSITNGTFSGSLTGWTDADESGATSSYDSTNGYMQLVGTGTASAIRYQTIASTDTGNPHGIRIVIAEAPVLVQIGTSGGSSDDIFSGELKPGTHALKFTPNSNITITFSNSKKYAAKVASVAFDSTGTLTLPTSVTTANLSLLRYAQSADVVFCTADQATQPFVIERRGTESWSIVDYRADDGPFNTINNTDITLTPGALSGNTTLTASKDYFSSDDVGRLFKVASAGQDVSASITAEDTGTNSILVTGVSSSRQFDITITGLSGTGSTITLQRSTDDATWVDVESYTTNQAKVYDDGLDNSLLYYRLHCKTGDYSSGTISLALSFAGGSIEGVGRVTAYTSATSVTVQVLVDFGSTDATRDWYAGTWNDGDGYPTAVTLYEGRLWFAGKTKAWGSVSDAYYSIDTGLVGDSAAIQKTVGFGPVDDVNWLLPLNRLIMGIASDEIAIRSDSYGTVLTPSNINLKPGTSQGAAPVAPVSVNSRGYFVQRSTTRLYELAYNLSQDIHEAFDLTVLNPSICEDGIKRIAVTLQPEIRVYVVLDSGEARVYLLDPTEDVKAWSRVVTDGTIEDVVVLPAETEDRVYFVVNRTGGRYLEKMALFSEAMGGTISKHLDSFVQYSSPGVSLTGLSHLEGKTVHVWADGQYREQQTVETGTITVTGSWTDVVVGLRHTAEYRTGKLARYVDRSVLTYPKRVVNVGFILRNYWPGALQVGPDETTVEDFPDMEDGSQVSATTLISSYDEPPFPFNGTNDSDPRIYLKAVNPVIVMAMTYGIDEANDPSYEQR